MMICVECGGFFFYDPLRHMRNTCSKICSRKRQTKKTLQSRRKKKTPERRKSWSDYERGRQQRKRESRLPFRIGICRNCGNEFKARWAVGTIPKECSKACKKIYNTEKQRSKYNPKLAKSRNDKYHHPEYQIDLILKQIAEVRAIVESDHNKGENK